MENGTYLLEDRIHEDLIEEVQRDIDLDHVKKRVEIDQQQSQASGSEQLQTALTWTAGCIKVLRRFGQETAPDFLNRF
jgi:hypothetical protein